MTPPAHGVTQALVGALVPFRLHGSSSAVAVFLFILLRQSQARFPGELGWGKLVLSLISCWEGFSNLAGQWNVNSPKRGPTSSHSLREKISYSLMSSLKDLVPFVPLPFWSELWLCRWKRLCGWCWRARQEHSSHLVLTQEASLSASFWPWWHPGKIWEKVNSMDTWKWEVGVGRERKRFGEVERKEASGQD